MLLHERDLLLTKSLLIPYARRRDIVMQKTIFLVKSAVNLCLELEVVKTFQ